jgi:hypothetical protein
MWASATTFSCTSVWKSSHSLVPIGLAVQSNLQGNNSRTPSPEGIRSGSLDSVLESTLFSSGGASQTYGPRRRALRNMQQALLLAQYCKAFLRPTAVPLHASEVHTPPRQEAAVPSASVEQASPAATGMKAEGDCEPQRFVMAASRVTVSGQCLGTQVLQPGRWSTASGSL